MSILQHNHRPWVDFDPNNKDHRRYYAEFLRNNTWGRCPVRFIVVDDGGDLLSLISEKLLTYYTEREFGRIRGCI